MNTIPKTITGNVTVWFSSFYGPEDITDDAEASIGKLQFSNHDMSDSGWSRAGTAQVTVTMLSNEEIVDAKIEGLRSEKTQLMASHQMAMTRIDSKIQQLLAITMSEPA